MVNSERSDSHDDSSQDSEPDITPAESESKKRHDAPGIVPKPPHNWKLEARSVVTVIKDSAPAASIAARHVFCFGGGAEMTDSDIERAQEPSSGGDSDAAYPEFREISCHFHASNRWISLSKLFVPYKKKLSIFQIKNLFQKDLDVFYKNIPFLTIKPLVLELLKAKWYKKGQQAAVDAWLKSWGEKRITRVEANQPDASPLRGGIPADNNALESNNNVDKQLLGREKCSVSNFVSRLGQDILGPISAADVQFNNALKERSKSCKSAFNKAPNNAKFFKHVSQRFHQFQKNPLAPHILTSMTRINFSVPNLPRGCYWFLSDHGIDRIKSEMRSDDNDDDDNDYDPDDINDVVSYMNKESSWAHIIETIIRKPEHVGIVTPIDFDLLHEWCISFHVFIPIKIRPTDDSMSPIYRAVSHWCEMMRLSRITTLTVKEIATRKGRDGMVACTCEMYMHYLICKHTLLLYLHSGIVTNLPKLGTPMLSKGRKRKAHGGEALTFDV